MGSPDENKTMDASDPAGDGSERLDKAISERFDEMFPRGPSLEPPPPPGTASASAPDVSGLAPLDEPGAPELEERRAAPEPLSAEGADVADDVDGPDDEDDDEDEDDGGEDAADLAAAAEGPEPDEGEEPDVDDPAEAARLAALASDLDMEAPDEAPEGEIPVERIDQDALKVVRRLHHFGYEAFLVGGCVRDLLLGRTPKDFDVATSAEPNQIRQVFRNCRLIGRRFRLAHVYFQGGKVIETSTFRANPLDEMDDLPKDLLISQDNVFGTSLEDAQRRDFTVNALFYDPRTGKVVDHVGGRTDLDGRVMRTIGDPDVRLREDPVRILRAVKFAARLDFSIDPATRAAMTRHAAEIQRCAAPRVLEEIYRLLTSGAARKAFQLLVDLELVPVLLPELVEALGCGSTPPTEGQLQMREEVLGMLDALDAIRQRGVEPSHALAMGALLWRLYLKVQNSGQDANRWLDDLSVQLVQRLRLTRRDRERLRVLLQTQRHLAPDRRRGGSGRATVRRGPFLESLLLYTLHLVSSGGDLAEVGQWKALAKTEGQPFLPGEMRERERDSGRDSNERRRHHGKGERRGDHRDHGAKDDNGNRRRRRGRRGGRR